MGRANPLWSAPQRAVVTGLVGALLIVALPGAYAAPTLKKPASQAELLSVLEKMNARLDQLEKRNAELERQLTAPRSATTKDIEQRVQTLEQEQIKLGKGLDSDRISEKEPELTARLKGVEMDVMSMKKAASTIDALEGLSATASLTTVAQKASGLPQGTVDHNSHLGYRADVTQFVPIEHTAKNLMIRSVKISPPGKNPRWLEEYKNLKSFWQVTPYLEKLLGDGYAHFVE